MMRLRLSAVTRCARRAPNHAAIACAGRKVSRDQSSSPPSRISDATANCDQHGGAKLDRHPDAPLCDERPDRRPDPLTIRLIERRIGLHVTMQRLGILEIRISDATPPDALDPVKLEGAQAGGAHLGR
jgi:hypothetical protein